MGKFLRTLAKVGLVELEPGAEASADAPDDPGLDHEAIERILAEEAEIRATAPAASPAAAAATQSAAHRADGTADPSIEEGRPFEEFYELAKVPASPYSAEKLLRLLDGLKAMEPAMRQAAVHAMDQADDAWTIDDAILDAQRKIRTLTDASAALESRMKAAEAHANSALSARDDYQTKAAASIRSQIADLEKMLEDELKKVAEEKAAIKANLDATRAAWQREKTRLEGECSRLEQLPAMFAPPPPAAEPKR